MILVSIITEKKLYVKIALKLLTESIINPSHDDSRQVELTDLILKEPEDSIRLCSHCLHLLENRKEMQDSRSSRPIITILYEQMKTIKKEVFPDIRMYEKIIDSLYEGNSVYTLNDASLLRIKIGRSAEILDELSKRVQAQKTSKGSREEALQKSLRLAAIKFIKENMLSLPAVPEEEDIKRNVATRLVELNQKIDRDRRLAQNAFEKYDLSGNSGFPAASSNSGSAMKSVDNWSGYQHSPKASSSNDPLVEQINIIKGELTKSNF